MADIAGATLQAAPETLREALRNMRQLRDTDAAFLRVGFPAGQQASADRDIRGIWPS
ncbi:hypothetical protein JOF48_001345 [Arthrobacter stackebrandtii]|uniref:Uncharacterized protein n=1 Tax=Arthrobacter stackebrandtii TaxID=272161 RepID=A0ABS4YUS6_9MICC|nr:hypothetical protein [Arthrobacter stackebrandtii]MBP2412546.1 hypothetical protein [Arthrobacter stackebrandtii]